MRDRLVFAGAFAFFLLGGGPAVRLVLATRPAWGGR